MKKTGFYIIKDKFFEDMPDPYLKGNKAGNRPHYYCFEDTNTGIYWMIPLSSRIDKYKKIVENKEKAGKPCDIIHIVKLDNRHPKKSNSTFFRIDGCNSCDFKDYCKRWMNKKEENFKIFEVVIELQKYINQSEENLLSPKGIELRVNRSIQVEGTFGMIKQDMPFDRFTRTSLDKVSTEFMMVCLGLNIRKLFKFYDAKSKNKFWIAPNDLQPETKKKPSAKRLSNKVNRKKLKKEADEPNPKD